MTLKLEYVEKQNYQKRRGHRKERENQDMENDGISKININSGNREYKFIQEVSNETIFRCFKRFEGKLKRKEKEENGLS